MITIDNITRALSIVLGIPEGDIINKSRLSINVVARRILIHFLRQNKQSWINIGKLLNIHHSSVIYLYKTFEQECKSKLYFAFIVDQVYNCFTGKNYTTLKELTNFIKREIESRNEYQKLTQLTKEMTMYIIFYRCGYTYNMIPSKRRYYQYYYDINDDMVNIVINKIKGYINVKRLSN